MRAHPVVESEFAAHLAGQVAVPKIRCHPDRNRPSRNQPALRGFGLQRNVRGPAFCLNVQVQPVCHLRAKHQWSAFRRQHQPGLLRAKTLRGIHGMKGRRLGRAHGRQCNYHYGLRIAERRRHIQTQVQRILSRKCQRGNVLKMRRMQRGQNLRRIHNRSHVRAVKSAAAHGRVAQLIHQVPGRSVGQLRHQRLRVRVVQHQSVCVLNQAGRLLVAWLVKALLVYPDAQRPRRFFGLVLQRGRIGLRGDLHVFEIRIEAHAIQARGLQILRSSHKRPGSSAHRVAQRAEVASRLRS